MTTPSGHPNFIQRKMLLSGLKDGTTYHIQKKQLKQPRFLRNILSRKPVGTTTILRQEMLKNNIWSTTSPQFTLEDKQSIPPWNKVTFFEVLYSAILLIRIAQPFTTATGLFCSVDIMSYKTWNNTENTHWFFAHINTVFP